MERPTSTRGGRERRRYERVPIKLEALIAFGDRPPIACVVKDFCVAGMFIQLEPRQLRLVEAGTPAELYFALTADGARHDLKLALQVARVIGSGLGVAFDTPDPQVIRLLQAFAAPAARPAVPATAAALGATQRRFAPEFAKALPALKELAERTASHLAVEFLRLADDALFLGARDAATNREQTSFLDAQTQLRKRGGEVKRVVPELLQKAVAMLGNPLGDRPGAAPAEVPGLSLVDKDEFEEFLTVSGLVAELEARFREALHDLGRRFSVLARREIEEADNPLGPAVVCNAFAEALKGLAIEREASDAMYKALRRTLEPQLERMYEEANRILVEHGVLPRIDRDKPVVKRSPNTAAGLRKTHPPGRPEDTKPNLGLLGATVPPQPLADALGRLERTAGSASRGAIRAAAPVVPTGLAGTAPGALHATGGQAGFGGFGLGAGALGALQSIEQAYSAAQVQLALRRQLAPAAPAAPGAAYSVGQLADGLSALQRELAAGGEPPLFDLGQIKERVSQALGEQGIRAIGQSETDAIEVIVNLFQSLLRDTLVADFAKGELKRLQAAVHRGALLDPQFFASAQHPLRQLINRVAMLRPGIGSEQQAVVAARVRGLVDEVNGSLDRDFGVLDPALRELDGILRDQRLEYDERVKDVVDACEDGQRVLRERRERADPAPGESTAAQALAPEWNRWLNRSRGLKVGERLLMNANTSHPAPIRLVWIGEDFNPYVFVDPRGNKAATLTLQQVAMYLRRGVLKQIHEDGDGAVDRALLGVVHRLHAQVAEQATHDTLTGLYNRKSFAQELEQRLPQPGEKDPGAVLVLLSVENLRPINEQHGVEAGDELIRAVSEALQQSFGKRPVLLGRLGGSEWGVYWPRGGLQATYKELQALLEQLGAVRVKRGEEALSARFAAGVTPVEEPVGTPEQLLAVVAEALNTARSQSDRPIYVAGSDNKHRRHLEQMVAYVAKAVARERLALLQQEVRAIGRQAAPAVRVVVSAEDRNGKLVPPALFAQAAALSAQAYEVDLWTLRHTLAWMAAHEDEVERYSAFIIPLSRAALEQEGVANVIVTALMETAVPPARICFEILERDAVAKLAETADLIDTLREFGCQFILAEFGSGQSNYEYVKGLAVGFVAIQGAILLDARQDAKDFAMAKSLNELVHFMGKLSIAPVGAEAALLDLVRDIGLDFIHDTSRATRMQLPE